MRTNVLVTVLTLCFVMLSCNKDTDSFNVDDTSNLEPLEVAKAKGTLSLKPVVKEEMPTLVGKPPTLDEVLDLMVVEIRAAASDELVISDNYRNLPDYIELEPGSYNFYMDNWNGDTGDARFRGGFYGTRTLRTFINAGENTVLDVSLGLFDVATTVNFSEEVKANYQDMRVSVEVINYYSGLPGAVAWYIADDMRTAYFSLVELNFPNAGDIGTTIGDMTITIEATGAGGAPISVTRDYGTVNANEHYILTIEQSTATSLSLNITLNDEVIITDEITFPN